MYKPTRRVHTSTGRFPFSRRSPSKRRAFLGVFNITKSFGRHDKCQRPRISLQIKRYKPITPPIIRRKHRQLPIFCPRSVCRDLRLQNTRKNARSILWDPSAAGAKRVGASQNGAWRIAWRARGPAAGLWCCGKRPCSRLAVWQMSDGAPDARTLCVRAH